MAKTAPEAIVLEYLNALEMIGVVEQVR